MIKRIATAVAVAVLLPLAAATPAEAHVSYCSKRVTKPVLVHKSNTRIFGSGSIRCPQGGHQSYVSADVWLEVYAPRWDRWGDGDWRTIGYREEDDDYDYVALFPSTALLYGKNVYRTRAIFTVHGDQGNRKYEIKTRGVTFNRYKHR